jgi:hypothetical protein
MNSSLIPVLIGTLMFFFLGIWISEKIRSRPQFLSLALISFLSALPAVLFDFYYTGLWGSRVGSILSAPFQARN